MTVLPPTEAGWRAFLDAARQSGLKFGELADAGRWWWGRSIPRNLLTGEPEEEEAGASPASPVLPFERRVGAG